MASEILEKLSNFFTTVKAEEDDEPEEEEEEDVMGHIKVFKEVQIN